MRRVITGAHFEVEKQVEIKIKYDGYIKRQYAQVEQMKRLENKKLPPDTDWPPTMP